MAIFRLEVSPIRRRDGRSAIAAAAYRAGERLTDVRTGVVHDYRRRQGVEAAGLLGWDGTRESLWQAAEAAERRRDARVAREVLVALPHELPIDARVALTRRLAEELHRRHGVAVDWTIHRPTPRGDRRNVHAHLLITTRRSSSRTLGEKARELDDREAGPQHVVAWRQVWAEFCNDALLRHGRRERVDHRSLAHQAAATGAPVQLPQLKLGPAATALERRGVQTWRGLENRRQRRVNAIQGRLWREVRRVTRELAATAMRSLDIVLFGEVPERGRQFER